MENRHQNPEREKDDNRTSKPDVNAIENDDAKFENPSVDPGFERNIDELTSLEDKREHPIDANKNISEMRSEHNNDDAMNYKNDREHGSYNPKNI